MAKGIFTTRVEPEYDDIPEIRYHFPRTYLNYVKQAVGDWVVYYEPRRGGGRLAYFAIAQVEDIKQDYERPDHFYAYVTNYIEFEYPVFFQVSGKCIESALNKKDGSINKGAFGRAVRLIPPNEFSLIVSLGFQNDLGALPIHKDGIEENLADYQRKIFQQIISRPFRDIQFSKQIRKAYNSTCAFTGLKMINGGGRCEVEAAHIRPVGSGHNGPDSIRNGIALSRTFHWMFDRGLISVGKDYRILLAERFIPEQTKRMINPTGSIVLPDCESARPHSHFLAYHREKIFKDG